MKQNVILLKEIKYELKLTIMKINKIIQQESYIPNNLGRCLNIPYFITTVRNENHHLLPPEEIGEEMSFLYSLYPNLSLTLFKN
jgi:hypothetical protein